MDTGLKALHPITGDEVPIWAANFVLMEYGHGAVMAVPAHDERDYAFAKQFGLPIREVVSGGNIDEAAYIDDGPHVSSEFLDGLNVNFYFGGTSLLIIVGVAMDTVSQVEAQLIMRHYDGFMRKGRVRGRRS